MKKAITITCTLLLLQLGASAESKVSEPDTLIYGKVLNRYGPTEHLLHEGQLEWRVSDPGNESIVLRVSLEALADGEYSYRLRVPHHAVALGLEAVSQGTLGLSSEATEHSHALITVDGRSAEILSPASSGFDLEQRLRGGTLRIDLGLSFPEVDGDGDGMPDWWEDAHGLDSQSDDAGLDPDGDGLNNLGEYNGGSDPNVDSRIPVLTTSEVLVYEGRITGLMLEVIDSDTDAENLVFTLLPGPQPPQLLLGSQRLESGVPFTLKDVQEGKLLFDDREQQLHAPTQVSLTLTDGNTDGGKGSRSLEAKITILPFLPRHGLGVDLTDEALAAMALQADPIPGVGLEEDLQVRALLLSAAHDLTIWDFKSRASDVLLGAGDSGLSRFVIGGGGDEELSGDSGTDYFSGGQGDDHLNGMGGGDRFIFTSATDGHDTITGYNPDEGDILDFTHLLGGATGSLSQYFQLRPEGGHMLLGVDVDGDGSGFDDVTVLLESLPPEWSDLHRLWAEEKMVAGALTLPPRISILATENEAGENESRPGEFTITRSGESSSALQVDLQIGGSATNGTDYSFLAPFVLIPAGQSSVTLTILPFQDGISEQTEIIEARVIDGDGYDLDPVSVFAQIQLVDLKPMIRVEALQAVAIRDTGQSALFLVSRTGLIQQSVFVRLDFSGSATSGQDFVGIPAFINLGVGEASQVIEVTPQAGAVLEGGAESVIVEVQEDASYLLGEPGVARVMIVDEPSNFDQWRASHFPDEQGPLADPDGTGFSLLERFAFGLDPVNPASGQASSGFPEVRIVDDHLTLSFQRDFAATGLDYEVEISEDMQTWLSGDSVVVEQIPRDAVLGSEWSIFQARRPVDENTKLYMRVRLRQ